MRIFRGSAGDLKSGLGQGSCFKTVFPPPIPLPGQSCFPSDFQREALSRQPLLSLCPLGVPQAGTGRTASLGVLTKPGVCHGYSRTLTLPLCGEQTATPPPRAALTLERGSWSPQNFFSGICCILGIFWPMARGLMEDSV